MLHATLHGGLSEGWSNVIIYGDMLRIKDWSDEWGLITYLRTDRDDALD